MSHHISYNLTDEVIAHIAKLLQLAILSGTDVVDHLRMVRLEPTTDNQNTLVLTEEYSKISDSQVEKMLDELEDFSNLTDADSDVVN